jgi:CheY-like chemotaxis protein/nitrogen-specific signal transduction histidine kinase
VHLVEELARRGGLAVTQARLFAEARASARAAEAAARAAEEASRIKDEFLATVSHELRTPLNAIVGWSSLLRGKSADPSVDKGLAVIHRNAQAQARIIDDILDVSRIITGNLRLDLKATDLVAVIEDAIEVVRASAAAKRIDIHFDRPSEPCNLVADAERLQQVVWNLLSNAVRFTDPPGSVRIRIGREASHLQLTVTDTGRGIEPGFLPYVFDRFRQADASTTRRVGGLGLGLAIVRHITELHGGRVSVQSAGSGAGASFELSLPIRAVSPVVASRDDTPASVPVAHGHPQTSLEGMRVLVVDDEPDARDLLQAVLERAGAVVRTAASAAEAMAAFPRFTPHVLVSDVGMPGEDGYTLMQRIRALGGPGGGDIPSIALTAYARAEDKTRALTSGFTAHIGKPVQPQVLLEALTRLRPLGR